VSTLAMGGKKDVTGGTFSWPLSTRTCGLFFGKRGPLTWPPSLDYLNQLNTSYNILKICPI
ncbi:hypothetical protein, partial [Sporolactobacillus inulinus]|uniref:hypothetical protein n=1 Tax=Sporolactobacillus inulinus TaxID=2078 RepID=UPI001ED99668